ncbi:phosphoribosylanthranilate isomerase [bacterium JGI 053]|nr:phosphoribosylanthranilate isomerase [bacterium JGI 053]
MEPTTRPRIKVCCISSVDEAWAAIRAGASALGLVSAMPSGPGVIGDELIAEVAARVPPGVATFLLTSATDADAIIRQQRTARVNTLQLVDAVSPDVYPALRAELPGVALVQVIHVRGPESVDEAREVAPQVSAILLDSGNPSAAVKELGGTGRVHDWELSRRIREAVDVPVYLAGGLRTDNAAEAVARVGPFGLDICSGVRTDGRLDGDKLAAFIRAATTQAA